MKKIAVLVSGNGSNLQALIDACKNKKIENAEINLVISSQENAFALKRAEKENIKSLVVSKKQFSNSEVFNEKLLDCLNAHAPDLIVLAGFMHILSKQIVQSFKNKIVNIHPSLIPAFCGKGFFGIKVHEKVLERGVKLTGATVHFVNEIADGGPIIAQKSVEIAPTDTAQSLQLKVMQQAEWIILPQAVDWFCSDRLEIKNNKVIVKKTINRKKKI